MNMVKRVAAVLSLVALGVGTAVAGVTDVFNDLVDPGSKFADFQGNWVKGDTAASDIDHIIVSADSGRVRVQVFGRCDTRVCNWGALVGRVRMDGPNSKLVRSIAADFNLGVTMRRITLHRLQGRALRFDLVTEYTDGSERPDYETSGRLVPLGTRVAAAPQAAPTPQAAAAPQAAPAPQLAQGQQAAPQPEPEPEVTPTAAATAAPSGSPGFLSSLWGSEAVTSGSSPANCTPFDTGHVYVAPDKGNWKVRDFLHTIQSFGPYRNAAGRFVNIVAHYRFDEFCRIGQGSGNMIYFRAQGDVPHDAMPGEDCTAVDPDKVQAVMRDDDWKVVDGNRVLYDYGSDADTAKEAATAIRTFALNRQCFVDRENTPASYWLAR